MSVIKIKQEQLDGVMWGLIFNEYISQENLVVIIKLLDAITRA